jgi:hypothetical protein
MSKLRFTISMSLDGFIAGPNQSVDHPLGMGGTQLHEWVVPLKVWRAMHGLEGGEVNESTAVIEESLRNIGASIMGRNMFGGHPGPWDTNKPWNVVGGKPIRPSITRCSSSRTIHASLLNSKAERRSHLSPRASRRLWNRRAGQPVVRMSPSAAEQELHNNISSPGL